MPEQGRATEAEAGSAAQQRALRWAGLAAASDIGMDRFARLVSRLLHAPVAFVSLVEEDRQILPGLVGLREPWAESRALPLSHSLCRYVVASGQPLAVPDARADERLRTHPAITDLGVIAYAGMPLTDAEGLVVGSLCAIDHEPRAWEPGELSDLEDLAAACSAELRLRVLSAKSRSAQQVLETARAAAEHARTDAQRLEQQAQAGMDHAELLLRASEELAQTSGLEDVRRRVRDLFVGAGKPSYVGLLVADKAELHRVADPDIENSVEREVLTLPVGAAFPSARAMRERRAVFVPDREALVAGYGSDAVRFFDRMGFTTVLCLPLWGSRALLGVLAICWDKRHEVGVTERATLTAASGYVAQAVERALYLDERISVARELQAAMLTDLPLTDHVEISALYQPAADDHMIGGDWYDAYHLPRAPASDGKTPALIITVGDITGHDMHAATIMGQVRSMLRQATVDHPPYSPATALTALDAACSVLPMETSGTLVHARLDPVDGGHDWTLTWSNAGHPPPLLRTPDGNVAQLLEHDVLVHRSLGPFDRTEHRRALLPGSTLLLYTDGLVERRGRDMDATVSQLVALLARHGNRPLDEVLRRISNRLAHPAPEDDVVLLAVRTPQSRSHSDAETAGAASPAPLSVHTTAPTFDRCRPERGPRGRIPVTHLGSPQPRREWCTMRFPFGFRSARAGRPRRRPRPTYGSWLAGTLSGTGVTRLPDRGDGSLVLVLAGEFDGGTVAPFRRALAEARASRAARTIIDVSAVSYADTGLLRLLVQAHHRIPRFTVAGPLPPQLRRLLEISGAAAVLRITPDIEAARRV